MARKPDFDVFEEKFKPIHNKSSECYMYETYGEDLDFVRKQKPECIWTVVDCDGKLYITPGYRIVNRFAYIITKKGFDLNQRDYKL